MKTIEIKGSVRSELGKKATRELRKNGQVPCVVYGGESVTHFTAPVEAFRGLIYTPNIYIVDLVIDGKACKAILKDIQYNCVSDAIEHIDFLEVNDKKPVSIAIPVKLNGLAEGVRQGGKLVLKLRKIRVKGLIAKLPDILDIDVTNLGLGKAIKIQDLSFDGLELLEAKNVVVATVKMTRAAVSAAAATEEK
ncbi:MAG: 50S ribosomal protein L25/general stress protein Ctc [Salinivirgaceae bacterium]|jgi:large subunit ribosomal protein L25|nr:50S ribosomal protein L25/general stress protein Ctc [Salinivirgaceae bacterium]MBO7593456.1 50S ribosomal protein L25/general stress protein Ctc [Salinivirgaceae bacterium]MBR5168880.1 50S ribosomal protein L25/general stress protein Ctc [Salinivirgaceae bacterium]